MAIVKQSEQQQAGLVPVREADYLEQDPEVRGQKFFCMSTVSPEDVLARKDAFVFNKFLGSFAADMTAFFANMAERFKGDEAVLDMLRNVRDRHAFVTDAKELAAELDFYQRTNAAQLESEFLEHNDFRTSVRGVKFRGAFETLREARARAEKLSKTDPSFNVYVGQVGCWCPWSPNPDDVEDQEYAETQLNTLVKKYKEGLQAKDEHYRTRHQTMLEAAKAHGPASVSVIQEEEEPVDDDDAAATPEDVWLSRRTA